MNQDDFRRVRLSIVIPTCRRPRELAACLTQLAPGAQTLDARHYEVIVTDDSPVEIRAEKVMGDPFPWVRWTAGPQRGPAANRNHGAGAAGGDVLVFFDDDCVPEPEVVAAYDRFFFEHGEVGAAEGRISPERPRQRMDEVAPINHSGGRFWSCNVAVRATVFERLGGFDERFPYPAMEDVEFHRRLLLAGVNPVFVPSAGVVHPWRKHGGWEWLRRQAIAHGIYARLDSADHRRIPLHVAIKRTWHHWRHEVLPGFKRYRGRGWQAPVRETLLPFWCDLEMRRAVKLPKLELWSPALRSKP